MDVESILDDCLHDQHAKQQPAHEALKNRLALVKAEAFQERVEDEEDLIG